MFFQIELFLAQRIELLPNLLFRWTLLRILIQHVKMHRDRLLCRTLSRISIQDPELPLYILTRRTT